MGLMVQSDHESFHLQWLNVRFACEKQNIAKEPQGARTANTARIQCGSKSYKNKTTKKQHNNYKNNNKPSSNALNPRRARWSLDTPSGF